jgi:hypothetical protein
VRILDHFDSPAVRTILDESVLRRPVGSPAVMCEQLRHIVALGDALSHRKSLALIRSVAEDYEHEAQ